nr:putative ribonuclease H-like domain-containing protein [Tanacetum cinerariifolium]
MNQNFFEPNPCYDSNSYGFDQPSQYPIDQSPPQEMSIQDMEDLKQHYSHEINSLSNQILIKDYRKEKIDIRFRKECKDLIDELKHKFNGMNIKITKKKELQYLEQIANLNSKPSQCSNSFYDDYEESTIPLNESISKVPPSVTITPILSTKDPEDSLVMGDEELNTIHEKESDEFIKSSVEDFVPIPSESKDTFESDNECDFPACDDLSPIDIPEGKFVTFSNPLFDLYDEFTSSNYESLSDEDVLEDNVLEDIKNKDPYDSDLDEPALLITPSTYPNEDECFNPGGDIDDLKTEDKVFHFEISKKIFFPTIVRIPFEDRLYLSFTYVIRISLLYFIYYVESPVLPSSEIEDAIFDPDIYASHFSSLKPVASHQSGTFMFESLDIILRGVSKSWSPKSILAGMCREEDRYMGQSCLKNHNSQSAQNNVVAKLPLLKQGDYEMWKLRIEQYFQVQDYALWDVIENGNFFNPLPRITNNADESLDSIFNRLQKIVSQLAILGENISQEDLNMKFLRSLPAEWNTHVVVWRNKPDLETMSFDDLYNNFKIVRQEVKRTITSSSTSRSQNMDFLSIPGSTNKVDTATKELRTVSTSVSTVSAHDSTANLSDATIYAFLANQPNESQLESRKYAKESRQLKKDCDCGRYIFQSKATVAIDGACFYWSYMADDEVPTNMALMAFSDSEFYEIKGIKRELGNARTPQQNKVAERKNRTLIEAARTMVLVTKPNNKTPYELLIGRTPIISFMRPFGCPVTILNTLDHLGKFDGKSDEGFLVGYSINSKVLEYTIAELRSLDVPSSHEEVVSSPKDDAGKKSTIEPTCLEESKSDDLGSLDQQIKSTDNSDNTNSTYNFNTASLTVNTASNKDGIFQRTYGEWNFSTPIIVNADGSYVSHPAPIDDFSKMPNLQDTRIFDDVCDDKDEGAEADYNNLETVIPVSPIRSTRIHKDHPKEKIIGKALDDERWVEAMQEELLQFKLLNVWTLVDLPHGKRAIGTKWVYRNKRYQRGIIVRNKARLVAQGHRQKEGIDYDEVFAPVARIEAIRLFLAYASFMYFIVYQMYVKSGFLYGTIEKEVYVSQPLGFVDPEFPDRVYKVEKALYGLHQALRVWYETLSNYLLENRFRRGSIGKTLFIKKIKNNILLVQVFQMSSIRELTFFPGLQVEQRKDGIFLSQDKYVCDILKKFGFSSVKSASTPMETHKPLSKDSDSTYVDVHLYWSMIGSLMYLTSSRPDIMFAVCACSRFQVQPKISHMHAVKRIFRYLKGQLTLGLWYFKDSPLELISYLDSDYAGASLDRKSITGGCQFLGIELKGYFLNDGYDDLVQHADKKELAIPGQMTTGKEFSNPLMADEAVNQEEGGRVERAITTDASLEDTGGSPRHQETIGGTPAHTRSKRVLEQPNDPPFLEGHTSGNGDGRLEENIELTDVVPKPYDSPLTSGYTPRSDEGRITLAELMETCTTLTNRVTQLENELSTTKRSSKVIHSSDEKGPNVHITGSLKQGSIIKEMDKNENINLVIEQGEVQETVEHSRDDDDEATKEAMKCLKESSQSVEDQI